MKDVAWPWLALGLDGPVEEIVAVKRAYATHLKVTRPDEDAQAYQELRAAYEAALSQLRGGGAESAQPPSRADKQPQDPDSAAAGIARHEPSPQPGDDELKLAIEVLQDFTDKPPTLKNLGASEQYWERLRHALDALPLQARGEASLRCAAVVLGTFSLSSVVALQLERYFNWTSDYKLAEQIGPDKARALREWVSIHRSRHDFASAMQEQTRVRQLAKATDTAVEAPSRGLDGTPLQPTPDQSADVAQPKQGRAKPWWALFTRKTE